MKLNNKKVTKLEGDASEREFYRSKNSIIIFSKKNKKKNLLIYDAINKILNSGGINAPRLLKNNYKNTTLKKLNKNFSYNSLENNFLTIKDLKNLIKKNFSNLVNLPFSIFSPFRFIDFTVSLTLAEPCSTLPTRHLPRYGSESRRVTNIANGKS